MMKVAGWLLRWVLLSLAIVVLLALSGVLAQIGAEDPPAPAEGALLPLLLFAAAVAATHLWGLAHSARGGWPLMWRLFVAVFGVMTVVTQVETLVYLRDRVSSEWIARFFVMGMLFALFLAPLAVMLAGRLRTGGGRQPSAAHGLAWKLPLIAALYLAIYYFFGYYVAWQEPALREYYGSPGEMRSFWQQLRWNWEATPWMFPFQMLRAVLWTALMLPLLWVLRMGRLQSACFTGVFFAMWSLLLLLPNPLMPEAVARAHLLELLPSNFLFGFIAGGLLAPE